MKLVRRLRQQGFNVERTGSGHWKVTADGRTDWVLISFSPSSAPQHKSIKRLKELGYKP
jgi:biotin operon repressor